MMRNICIFVSLLLILPAVYGLQSGLRHGNITHYDEEMNWKEAQSFCREKHMDLVTITSEEENQLFLDEKFWTGLYREDESSQWKWSRGDENATFFYWAEDEPNNYESELCVMRWPNGKWYNNICEERYKVICYGEKLVLVKENKTWEEALEHCRSLGGRSSENPVHSYDLATLITEDDHVYAREKAQHATTDEVWTGLRFLGKGWFWISGEPVQYQDIPSCPAFSCGVLKKNSSRSFGIRDCRQRRNFFCYRWPANY